MIPLKKPGYGPDVGADDSHGTVVLAQVLFRHGDRSPIKPFPTDKYKDSWPQGYGQLSMIGMRQQYHLGQYLRQRYMLSQTLLNTTYIHDQIRVRSTDVDRTLMSAYSNLAGLYPPTGSQVWDPQIPWQPIPVHTVPRMEDKLLNEDIECPTATKLYNKILNSPAIRKEEQTNKPFYEYVSKNTGQRIENLTKLWTASDTFKCEMAHNMTLPDWALVKWNNVSTVREKAFAISAYQFYLEYDYNRTVERLRGGPLLKEMIKNMNASIAQGGNQTDKRTKLFMFSAHDSTVSPFLGVLNVYNRIMPPYAAAVLVELYNASGKYSVQVHYRNDSSMEPYLLQIPGCTAFCPYDKFLALTFDMVPVDWDTECQGPSPDDYQSLLFFLGVAMAAALLVLLVLSIGLIVVCSRKKKLYNQGYMNVQDKLPE
ncbi:Prostatic acid phosphatase [Lamellibrachia satsuma]|nr:Prostatic acid phosphatase [Lamellibrachia satsuma]